MQTGTKEDAMDEDRQFECCPKCAKKYGKNYVVIMARV